MNREIEFLAIDQIMQFSKILLVHRQLVLRTFTSVLEVYIACKRIHRVTRRDSAS